MEYLERVGRECEKELMGIGINCGKVARYKWKDHIREWGMCIYVGDGKYFVLINIILSNPNYFSGLKNVMTHELLHTLPDCIHHTTKWNNYAQLVKQKLGYNIQKTNNYYELGIPVEEYIKANDFKYVVKCKSCGTIIGYKRKSDVVIRPYRYVCNNCGGNFEIITMR